MASEQVYSMREHFKCLSVIHPSEQSPSQTCTTLSESEGNLAWQHFHITFCTVEKSELNARRKAAGVQCKKGRQKTKEHKGSLHLHTACEQT